MKGFTIKGITLNQLEEMLLTDTLSIEELDRQRETNQQQMQMQQEQQQQLNQNFMQAFADEQSRNMMFDNIWMGL